MSRRGDGMSERSERKHGAIRECGPEPSGEGVA